MSLALPNSLRLSRTWQARLRWLRQVVRGQELALIALAAVVGLFAGGAVTLLGQIAQQLHESLFRLPDASHLSALTRVPPWRTLGVLAGGGLLVAGLTWLAGKLKQRTPVDPIEANALHGGQMSLLGSLVVVAQNLASNGAGASVGQEAGYTQIAAGVASRIGRGLNLRRNDLRTLVACGAAGAIAGAFNAPLAGAFYGFELILGSYSIATLAPVLASALASTFVVRWLVGPSAAITATALGEVTRGDYLAFAGLGFIAALFGIGVMQGVTLVEQGFRRARVPTWLRPMIGGLAVGGLAIVSPTVLGAGHGALHVALGPKLPWYILLMLVGLKALASAISVGSGFRGGLFFASLFLGAVFGACYSIALDLLLPGPHFDQGTYLVVGMAAMAAAIIGGPLTMTFLALEITGDFPLTIGVLLAVVIASLTVRRLFGYSFATWRFHLRGETIRSAHDVGWIRSLTVGRLMRRDLRTVADDVTLAAFRRQFPLGSTTRVIAIDPAGHYAGIVPVPAAHQVPAATVEQGATVASILTHREDFLLPQMNAKEAIDRFATSEADALAVLDASDRRNVLGLLTEVHAVRRYAEELDKRRREAIGEL